MRRGEAAGREEKRRGEKKREGRKKRITLRR
jgi:hypothetical protein